MKNNNKSLAAIRLASVAIAIILFIGSSLNTLAQSTLPVAALAFTTQPGQAYSSLPFGQQPVLQTVDSQGNPTIVGLASTQYVTVSLSAGAGPLLGTLTYNIGAGPGGSNGVINFTNLQINAAGANDTLTASFVNSLVPTNIPNCMVWLDPSDPTTITGTSSVTAVADKSGNGNTFNIPIGTTGNIAYTNTMNALGVVTFTGGGAAGEVLHNNTYRNTGTTVTWFSVWRHSSATPKNFETPLSSSDGTDPDYNTVASFAPSATTPGGVSVDPRQERTSVVDVFTTATTIGTTAHILDGEFDGANSFLYLDGLLSQTHNASSGNFNIQVLSLGQRLDVGGTSSSVSSWQGDIAEILVYNSALNSSDQASVRNYLDDKWVYSPAVSAPFNVAPPPAGGVLTLWPAAGTLATGTTGMTYSATFSATGGLPGYTYAVTGGSLPPGLALSTQGQLSGTPATAGNYVFSVAVTDQNSTTATAAYTLTVSSSQFRDLYSDTWVGADSLGRVLLTSANVGPPNTNQSGIFYFLWEQGGNSGPYNIPQILAANPYALTNANDPPWGPYGAFHYWSEPLFGYYQMLDPWVLRKHAQMLKEAGVDMVLFDGSNGYLYTNCLAAVANTWTAMQAQGNATPQFAYLCIPSDGSNEIYEVQSLYNSIYSQGLYSNLWYYWEGKPVICAYPDSQLGSTILNFFTFRKPFWQGLNPGPDSWNTDGYYPGGYNGGGTNEIMYDANGHIEQMAAATASSLYGTMSNPNASGGDGRTWRDFAGTGSRDTGPNAVASGGQYTDEWGKVLQYNPPFSLTYCWNEWVAQRLSLTGVPVTFVDEFDPEYSKDIEPMLGGFEDDYYMQMVSFQRQYKGARPLPGASAPQTILLNGNFTQWNNVAPTYYDAVGDTATRNYSGWGNVSYTDNSGRNDLVAARVAVDGTNVYFWVQTAASITSYTGANWMQLLLDVDGNHTNGWNGYDFIVNSNVVNSTTTTLIRISDGATWNVSYQLSGNQMMIAIPRVLLGLTSRAVSIDFHWVDNCPAGPGNDINNFWSTGDSAPDGHFNYRYSTVAAISAGLVLANPGLSGNIFTVSVSSFNGLSYQLQYKNSLTDLNWTALPSVPGNGGTLVLTDSSATFQQRFYRVQQF